MRARQIGVGAADQRQHPFGRAPFARVQQRPQPGGVVGRGLGAELGQERRLVGGFQRGVGPEIGDGIGARGA
ncbi:hypothetical protein [Paracoccus luteus]|uniref:hypothetical protein n=1 Tax=Paracoccus luteus TaxID=2508543 RepID=UPI001FEB794F|nr:hypothetical protein [Paracoccus luteus]